MSSETLVTRQATLSSSSEEGQDINEEIIAITTTAAGVAAPKDQRDSEEAGANMQWRIQHCADPVPSFPGRL